MGYAPTAVRSVLFRSAFVLFWLVLFWLVTVGSAKASDSADNGRLVYCLGHDQLPKLVEASVALGLADQGSAPYLLKYDGQDTTVAAWRKVDRKDFDTACEALVEARDPGRSQGANPVLTSLGSVLQVGAGALIGLVATTLKGRVDWGRQQADELRRAAREFDAAAHSYVREASARERRGSAEPFRMTHTTLSLRLQGLVARRRRSAWARDLLAELDTGSYGPQLALGWDDGDPVQRAEDLSVGLQDFGRRIEELATALEHPFRWNAGTRAS
jgi:hypothetical protein